MNSKYIRHRILQTAIGFALFLCACSNQHQIVADESYAFPPTATFPAVTAPILVPKEPVLAVLPPNPDEALVLHETTIATLDLAITPRPTVTQTREPTVTSTTMPIPTPTPCSNPGQIVTNQYDSAIAGRISYRVYLPPCYSDSGRTYPTLYMLPGNIHTDAIWDDLGLDEAAELGIIEKRYQPLIIVMVSGGSLADSTSGGPGSFEMFMMDEFVPYIEGTYCAVPHSKARAIGGLSRGGYWALEIAFRHPEEFVSVGGHSAALVDFNGGPTINPAQTGLTNDLGDLRIYLDIGENDWLIPNLRQLHEQMTAEGRDHSWVLNEGRHEEVYWESHLTDYLDWYSQAWADPAEDYPPCRVVSTGYSP